MYENTQTRKTNDAKSRKWPKTSVWTIFWRFQGQVSPNCNFFWKNKFHSNWRPYLEFQAKNQKNRLSRFWEKDQSVWFWANLETFSWISPIQDFFSKIQASLFYLYSLLTSCEKSEKSLEPFLRKLCYQPTNYYQQQSSYRTSLTLVQKKHENSSERFTHGLGKTIRVLNHVLSKMSWAKKLKFSSTILQ